VAGSLLALAGLIALYQAAPWQRRARADIPSVPGAYREPAGTSTVPHLYQRAAALLAERRFAAADSVYSEIIRIEPENPAGHAGRGTARLYLEDYDAAAAAYETAVARDSTYTGAWIGLGSVAHRRGAYPYARKLYQRAVAIDGTSPDAHWGLAITYDAVEDRVRALEHYQRALALAPRASFAPLARERIAALQGGG